MASQTYLDQHPPVTHPQQLAEHRCIAHRAWNEWVLKRDSQYHRWLLPPAHLTDNLLYARESALGHAGITLLPRFLTDGEMRDARLVQVLP